mmetsp:Transcript_18975/g.43242  ORF Transcript_18975/g.43242 Transcript_18975/m.43242 type:complete len:325 (-) Transcript_18975:116-1090(-)
MIKYPNIAVTSIEVDEKEDNIVEFSETSDTGAAILFLKDIEQISGSKKGERLFKATKVAVSDAKKIISEKLSDKAIPLFCVHGFNVEPGNVLKEYVESDLCDKFKKFGDEHYPIPVLWACDTRTNFPKQYTEDQRTNSKAAGEAFKDFVNSIDDVIFPHKSLLMHSMGNHVIFNGACGAGAPDVHFDNIFMVAADLPHDIFHKDPAENYKFAGSKAAYGNKREKATNFMKMLVPSGKVHILHNADDYALTGSSYMNWECRLGQRGAGNYQSWWGGWHSNRQNEYIREDIIDQYCNIDCKSKPEGDQHSYQFDTFAIKQYCSCGK